MMLLKNLRKYARFDVFDGKSSVYYIRCLTLLDTWVLLSSQSTKMKSLGS